MKRTALAAALAFAACSPAGVKAPEAATDAGPAPAPPAAVPGAPPVGIENALTWNGWGPLRIGMTEDEIAAAMGPDANPNAVGGPDEEACNEYRPERAPEGLLVMTQQRRLTRISLVDLSSVKTDKGLGIGDAADAVKAAYGAEAKAAPHKYQDAPAEYVTVWSGGPRTGPGKVGMIHAGGPSIQYVEGCA